LQRMHGRKNKGRQPKFKVQTTLSLHAPSSFRPSSFRFPFRPCVGTIRLTMNRFAVARKFQN
jgi:hypothetical protein